MRYKNTRTGAVIDSLCNISGKYWVKVESHASDEEKVNTDVPSKVTDTPDVNQIVEEVVEVIDDSADGIDGITVKEIKQELYELMLNGK